MPVTRADELDALAERVENATAPDGELEAEIWLAVTDSATRNKWSYIHKATGRECWVDETRDKFGHLVSVPRYMESLDAAMSLVPEGMWPEGSLSSPSSIEVHDNAQFDARGKALAATPALALTAACLRAQASIIREAGR